MAAERETYKANTKIEGLPETLRAFKQLDKGASEAAKAEAMKIAELLAARIRAKAPSDKRYQNLAVSVKAGKDRVPVIRIGGRQTPRVSGGAGPAQLVIGMEFGANQNGPNGWRFPPRTPKFGRGNQGYWIFPTARVNQTEIIKLWFDAMDKLVDEWSR
jgi:hypothetical protein